MLTVIVCLGELDTLISAHNGRLVMAPVFGAPPVAEAGKLLVVMAGDYRSKKEVAHILIPGVGRKVIDLGGNLEKGASYLVVLVPIADIRCSTDVQTPWKLHDPWKH